MANARKNEPKIVKRKIVLVGMAHSGKTELMTALVAGSAYQFEKKYEPTVGATVTRCELKNQVTHGAVVDHLEFRDTAGRQQYRSLLKEWLKGVNTKDTVVFTLDPTQDSREPGKYLKEQKDYLIAAAKQCAAYCPKGKFILTVTKNDVDKRQRDFYFNETWLSQLAGALSKELRIDQIDIVYCSAKKKQGLEELSDRLTSHLPEELQRKVSGKAIREMAEVVKRKNLVKYIQKNVIQILIDEKQRLEDAYGKRHATSGEKIINDENAKARWQAVEDTIQALNTVLKTIEQEKIQDKEKIKKALEKPIVTHLEHFDKRKGSWGKKLAQILLNTISAVGTLGLAQYVKYKKTADPWLRVVRMEGKTSLAGDEALKNVRKIPGLGK